MKRFFCLLLILSAILMPACSQRNSPAPVQPAQLYYLSSEITYHKDSGVIACEPRDVKNYADSLNSFIAMYLQGPESSDLISPFPSGLKAEEIMQSNSLIQITLSKEFSKLEGIDMTLSCSCLAATIKEYTGVEYVYISYKNAATGKRHTLSLGPDSFQFYDDAMQVSKSK